MPLVEYTPEMLQNIAETLPTGTLLFCYKPFVAHEITSYTCAGMRWAARSKRYHHGAILRWDCGMPFVIEATFFQRSRPKKLENWVQERKGYIIGVKPQKIDEARLVKELDKPYDNAAALSLVWFRVTGRWNGHTGTHAEAKDICWELMARTLGFEKPWMVDIEELLK